MTTFIFEIYYCFGFIDHCFDVLSDPEGAPFGDLTFQKNGNQFSFREIDSQFFYKLLIVICTLLVLYVYSIVPNGMFGNY